MPSLAAIRATNSAFSPAYAPVALFVGGTAGIGQGMAEAFGRYTKGNARIIIIGRNRAAAESIIAKLPKSTIPGISHEFIQCDVTLMKNVHSVTSELLTRIPKINFLVMSPGIMTLNGRNETEEGIDRKLAVHYYARWKFAKDLLPALQKAKDAGEDAKVVSVLAPGHGGEIDLDDLGLKKSYSVASAGLVTPTYNDLMMEEFSERHPDLTFVHAYPGLVRTSIMKSSDSALLRMSSSVLLGLGYAFSTSSEECAEYMWHATFNSNKGVFRTGSQGEDISKKRYFGSESARKKLWEHTVEETKIS